MLLYVMKDNDLNNISKKVDQKKSNLKIFNLKKNLNFTC